MDKIRRYHPTKKVRRLKAKGDVPADDGPQMLSFNIVRHCDRVVLSEEEIIEFVA